MSPGMPLRLALAVACSIVRGAQVPRVPRPGPRFRQGALKTGRPFDFSDRDRDAAAEAVLGELSHSPAGHAQDPGLVRGAPGGATVHFFAESDCPLFRSPEACARARRAVTYLASYPCSGNTWVRTLFEQTLLLYTGSVFEDPLLLAAGMRGENVTDPSRVFMVKTHWPVFGVHTEGGEIKNLAIVREPLHAALSWCIYGLVGHNRDGLMPKEVPKDELERRFNESAGEELQAWANMARTFSARSDTHVVRYEDVVADTRRAFLEDILPFVGVNPSLTDISMRLSAAIVRADQAYTAAKNKRTYTFEFTDYHRDLARTIVGPTLAAEFGYQL